MRVLNLLARSLCCQLLLVALPSFALAAGPSWGPPQRIDYGERVSLALADDGAATIFFHRATGCCIQTFVSTRPPNGIFGPPQPVSPPGEEVTLLDFAVDANGLLTALFARGDFVLEARTGPVGGALGSAQPLGRASQGSIFLGKSAALATPGDDDLLAVWATGNDVFAARGERGDFGPAEMIGGARPGSMVEAALGAGGHALAAWASAPQPSLDSSNDLKATMGPPGGSFGPVETLDTKTANPPFGAAQFFGLEAVVDRLGGSTLAWGTTLPEARTLQGGLAAALSPPGGPFRPARLGGTVTPDGVQLGIDSNERTIALWRNSLSEDDEGRIVYATHEPSDVSLSPPALLEEGGYAPALAEDAGAASWARGNRSEVRALVGTPREDACVQTVGRLRSRVGIVQTVIATAPGGNVAAAWSTRSERSSRSGVQAVIAEPSPPARLLVGLRRARGGFRLRLAAAARVGIRVERHKKDRWRVGRKRTRSLPAGPSLVTLGRRALTPGRYRAIVTAQLCGGSRSRRVLRFRVGGG